MNFYARAGSNPGLLCTRKRGPTPTQLLGLLNSDIDLERRVLHLERGVKEVWRRDGLQAEPGRDVKVGKLKSATSKRTIPLNGTAIAMIQDLRKETYFGEDTPLVPDEHGNYTRTVNFRKRYYRILAAAGIEKKGLHSLRHTFASNLVNGIKQEDGTIREYFRKVCGVPALCVDSTPTTNGKDGRTP